MATIRFREDDTTHFLNNKYPCVIQEGERSWPDAHTCFLKKTEEELSKKHRMRYELSSSEEKDHDLRVMKQVLRAKFTQHPELKEKLLATGNANIVMTTRYNSFWGEPDCDGCRGPNNQLGYLLKQLRSKYRKREERKKYWEAKRARCSATWIKEQDETNFLNNKYPCVIKEEHKEWPNADAYFHDMSRQELDKRNVMQYELNQQEWEEHQYRVMKHVLWTKFQQHPELQEKLVATGSAKIVLETKGDNFWGECDLAGCHPPQNQFGKLLMRLRDMYQHQANASTSIPTEPEAKKSQKQACCIVCSKEFPDTITTLSDWILICSDCKDYNDLAIQRLVRRILPSSEPVSVSSQHDSDSDMGF